MHIVTIAFHLMIITAKYARLVISAQSHVEPFVKSYINDRQENTQKTIGLILLIFLPFELYPCFSIHEPLKVQLHCSLAILDLLL